MSGVVGSWRVRGGQTDAVGAGCASGVDEVDGVDAVAAAALGVSRRTLLKMVRPRKLSSLPTLSALSPSWVTEKLATGVGVPGSWWASGAVRGIDELRACAEDDAVGLRVRAVAGVAGGVEDVRRRWSY